MRASSATGGAGLAGAGFLAGAAATSPAARSAEHRTRPVRDALVGRPRPGLVPAWCWLKSRSILVGLHREESRGIPALDEEDDRFGGVLVARLGDGGVVVGHVLDRLIVHFLDHVAALETGVIGRAPLAHVDDHDARLVLDVEAARRLAREGLDPEPELELGLRLLLEH